MTQSITSVPESITRQRYIEVIESLGFDPYDLKDLRFGAHGIYATVAARDENGKTYNDPLERNQLAAHKICIKITDK